MTNLISIFSNILGANQNLITKLYKNMKNQKKLAAQGVYNKWLWRWVHGASAHEFALRWCEKAPDLVGVS